MYVWWCQHVSLEYSKQSSTSGYLLNIMDASNVTCSHSRSDFWTDNWSFDLFHSTVVVTLYSLLPSRVSLCCDDHLISITVVQATCALSCYASVYRSWVACTDPPCSVLSVRLHQSFSRVFSLFLVYWTKFAFMWVGDEGRECDEKDEPYDGNSRRLFRCGRMCDESIRNAQTGSWQLCWWYLRAGEWVSER